MDKDTKTEDVDLSGESAQSAAVGTTTDDTAKAAVEGGDDKSSQTDQETKSEETTTEDTDFESVLLAPEDDSTKGGDEEGKGAAPAATGSLSEYVTTLKGIREALENLPENADEGSVTKKLRQLNRELLTKHEAEVSDYARLEQFGSRDRIEDALSLYDGLNGYDTTRGAPSAHKAAEMLVEKQPEIAYNLALNVMRHNTKEGTPFAELFTRNVLGLDPKRIADFQAISRGEIPEGYEGMIASTEDLAAINPSFHDAYKRLTPKMREIVKEGMDQYARPDEKAEAQRILQDSLKAINDAKKDEQDAATKDANLAKNLETKAIEIEGESTTNVGTRIQSGLDKLVFSSDVAVDLTMKQALNTQVFNLVHESQYVRNQAENYFKAIGVDIARERKNIDYHFSRLSENIDIEAVARTKGQVKAAEEAHRVRKDAETRLAAIGLSLVAQVARKTKAGLKAKGETKVPEGQLPATDQTKASSTAGNGSFDYKAAAAATREGKTLSTTAK